LVGRPKKRTQGTIMLRVLTCLGGEHDLRLVALAGIICFLASVTAISLFHRAQAARDGTRAAWILTAGMVTGCGIWATHFIAMLAYTPGVPVAYDLGLTILSLAVAVVVTSIGLSLAIKGQRWSAASGGAIVGSGVASMHYTGMSAVQLPGHVGWSLDLVVVSVAIGIAIAIVAMTVAVRRDDTRSTLLAGTLLVLAIVSHHFTAMGAVEVVPDPTRVVAGLNLSPTLLALVIANVALVVLGLSLAAAFTDRIRERDLRLATAVSNLSQGVVMFDAHHRVVVCNESYMEMYGLSPKIVKPGCTLGDVIRHRIETGSLDLDADKYRDELVRAMEQGRTVSWIVESGDGRAISVINRPFADGYWVGTHEDITERRRAEKEIETQNARFEAALTNMSHGLIMFGPDRRLIVCNKRYAEIYGLPLELIRPGTMQEEILRYRVANGMFAASGAEESIRGRVDNALSGMPSDSVVELSNGRFVAVSHRPMADGGWVSTHEDITERRRAERELERTKSFLNKVIENVPATIVVKDAQELRYVLINRAGERYYGVPRDQLIGKTAYEIFPPATARFITEGDRNLIESGREDFSDQHAIETPGNGTRIVTSSRLPMFGDDGKPQYLLAVIDDVTERKQAEERIAHMAHHDALTDLPNRAAFTECLRSSVEKAAKANESFAVMCMDLDRFKEVNDVFGHSVGDALLREVSRRLQGAAAGAVVARLGGDEFTLIGTDGPSSAGALAERLLASVDGDLEIEGHLLRIGLSIGVAVYPTDGTDPATLFGNADAALYRAKTDGRGTIRFFHADMDQRLRERRALQHELRSALENGELVLHYQPQASIRGAITGFEALIRWFHPSRGLVPPGTFIPLAEESGSIIEIGEWTLRQACREAASWPKPLQVAINLSPVQFRHGDLPGLVHSVLLETGLAPGRLELEITEGVLIGDYSRAVSILRRLKSLGVRIAMDDFGTGYSSLSYLQAFPFDKIKIDRAFIANLERNAQSAAIIRAVIGLGRGLNLPVVAEGVETEGQLAFLTRESCDEVQGYLVGRPAPIDDFAAMVGRPARRARKAARAG
jgi:diguanylate cyclase (GGDEF)-like protein/PAS domain S-box-containing protein